MPESTELNNQTNINNILTLLTIFVPLAWSVYTFIYNPIKNKGWELHPKGKGNFFFSGVLLFSIMASFIISCCLIILKNILPIYIKISIINKFIYYTSLCALYIISCLIILRHKSVKKRTSQELNKSVIILLAPISILLCIFILYDFEPKVNFLLAPFFINEFIGLNYFSENYLVYPYSYVNIQFSNSKLYRKIDIDKIVRKRNWIIIKFDFKEIRMRIDDIEKIEYFGEEKVKIITDKRKEKSYDNI